ncbi:MAG: DUF488 domain-containing protein [Smithellaceae bacterium]|nr:DUF488 domain-containing protein [Smithellaceae bacterium]
MVKTKRIYDAASPADGRRVLVDRLWPRGLTKEAAAIDEWKKDIAPSDELRKWFAHDPAKWNEFRSRYRKELQEKKEALTELRREAKKGTLTLLYAAHDQEHNNAVVLKELIE